MCGAASAHFRFNDTDAQLPGENRHRERRRAGLQKLRRHPCWLRILSGCRRVRGHFRGTLAHTVDYAFPNKAQAHQAARQSGYHG